MTDRIIGRDILSSTFVTEKILGIFSLFCVTRYVTCIALSMIVLDWEGIYLGPNCFLSSAKVISG